MRQFLVAALLTMSLAAVCTTESAALFRRRRCPPPCPCPCPCPAPCSPLAYAPPVAPPAPVAPPVTITIKGKTYVITDTGERGEFEHDKVVTAPGEAPCPDDGETFCGTQRRAAKISIAPNTTIEAFDDVGGLLPTLVPDLTMRDKHIPRGATSNRIPEENRNVQVKKA